MVIDCQLTLHDGSRYGRKLAPLESIPLDVMYHVADHCTAEELVTLSTLSKPLRDLLRDPGIWKTLYRRATNAIPLPPGPYDWQSTSYLVNTLLRAEKYHSVWPSSWSCPEPRQSQTVNLLFKGDVAVSVLLARWLLVAERPTLCCYDSRSCEIAKSKTTLMHIREDRPILRIFSAGRIQEEGILAFAVLVFKDAFTIVKLLMDQERPSGIETVFTSIPITVEGWTDLVDVRLYHRLLVVTIGECSSDWDSSGRLVLLDIDTLRRYRIPTDHAGFDPMHTATYFYATKTHLVKVMETGRSLPYESKLRCFPLPTAREMLDGDILYPSHRTGILIGPRMRQHSVILDSGVDPKIGRVSFVVCGSSRSSDGDGLDIAEISLEPDGDIFYSVSGICRFNITSFCVTSGGQPARGIALCVDERLLVFALNYYWPRGFSFRHYTISRKFPECDLMPLDTFDGTVFLSSRSSDGTSVEMIDFSRHAEKVEGCIPECITTCQCSYCQDFFDGR